MSLNPEETKDVLHELAGYLSEDYELNGLMVDSVEVNREGTQVRVVLEDESEIFLAVATDAEGTYLSGSTDDGPYEADIPSEL